MVFLGMTISIIKIFIHYSGGAEQTIVYFKSLFHNKGSAYYIWATAVGFLQV